MESQYLLNRLVQKRAVGIKDKTKGVYIFIPLLNESKYKIYKTKEFINLLFNGSTIGFLIFLAENNEEYYEEIKKNIERNVMQKSMQ